MVKTHKDESPANKTPEPEPAAKAPEPEAVQTIADEQRKRSEEIQAQGVEAFKAAHDDRPESERGASTKQVPGINHPTTDRVSER